MYRRAIDFDKDSFLELASRITGEGEQLMISLRGLKNDTEATIASAMLDQGEVEQLIVDLKGWLDSAPKNLEQLSEE